MAETFKRQLGRSKLEVSPIGLGCWAIGGPFYRGETPVGWGEVDDSESIQAIHRGLDLGVNFLDTANVYGAGHSERVLAKALAGKRHQVVIATKFGNIFDETTRQVTGADASPASIRQQCEQSLQRLNTDYIDLYQFHLGGHDMEEAALARDALEGLVKDGKIRWYGWSTDDPQRAKLFAEGPHCTAVQHQMNVLTDEPDMVALCEQLGLASINRGPLAMGLLTGKFKPGSQLGIDDVRGAKSPGWMSFFKDGKPNPEWFAKVEAVREILTSGGRSMAQGALAWLWARSPKTIPIPGFKTVAQIEENVGAMQFGPLTAEQMAEIEAILVRENA
jgi:aryl-alcohol dehydrogenase-like predicted oxidoreductase